MRKATFCIFLFCASFFIGRYAVHAEASLFEWTFLIGADGETVASATTISQSGGLIIAGATNSQELDAGKAYGSFDAFVSYVSDNGELVWQKRFGGSKDDRFTHIMELSDGSIIAMGTTLSTDEDAKNARGGLDVFIVYLTHEGEVIWVKCLGGTYDDEMLAVAEADDGSILVCGRSQSRNGDLPSNKGGWDAWATFLSRENGRPIQRILDGTLADEQFTKIFKTSSGWLLLGDVAETDKNMQADEPYTQISPFALALSSDGGELWKASFGGLGINRLVDAVATDASSFVLFGETDSTSLWMPSSKGGHDIWILSLRANGAIAWQWTYGGAQDENFHSVIPNANGGYFILASTQSTDGHVRGAHGATDLWVVSISKGGTFEWQQTLGGSRETIPAGILQTVDGGILVAGTTYAQDGDFKRHVSNQTAFLAMLSSNGNLEWTSFIDPDQEIRLCDLVQQDRKAYLLGSVYDAVTNEERIVLWKLNGIQLLAP